MEYTIQPTLQKLVNVALVSPGPILSEGGEGAGGPGAGAGAGCVALLTHSGVLQLWQDKLTEIDVADAVMKMPGTFYMSWSPSVVYSY